MKGETMRRIIIATALTAAGLAIALGLPAEALSESIKYGRVRW